MRKIILAIALCLSSCICQAQNDITYYNQKIDSLIQVYSVPTDISEGDLSPFFKASTLTVKEKIRLIGKIEKLYKQEKYTNLYALAGDLLSSLFRNSTDIGIRQQIMEISLEHYFYPGTYGIISHNIADYSPKARELLRGVLQEKGKEKLYHLYLLWSQTHFATMPYLGWDEAKKILKETGRDSTYLNQVRDSIMEFKEIIPYAKEVFERFEIDSELIYFIIGRYGMKECIPDIKKALIRCVELECEWRNERNIRYALVRLGDKEQEDYLINNGLLAYENIGEIGLRYLRRERLLWAYLEYNWKRDEKTTRFSSSPTLFPVRSMSIEEICHFVKNLPPELAKNKWVYSKEADTDDEVYVKEYSKNIDKIYDWLMANKDKVVFDFGKE